MPDTSILIADDDVDVLTALTLRCEQLGLRVRIAHDAMAALLMIRADPPGLVIIDVNMPGGNGLSVCEMLGSDKSWQRVPSIILTGQSDEDTIARCHRAGACYVPKGGDVWQRVRPLLSTLLRIAAER
ncbi:MAG TPA: response regulator [Pirellulales bacterium]|jgi:DNA-binding response OmpR family regulator|nr:response regulator [Pirellulales bacterium]